MAMCFGGSWDDPVSIINDATISFYRYHIIVKNQIATSMLARGVAMATSEGQLREFFEDALFKSNISRHKVTVEIEAIKMPETPDMNRSVILLCEDTLNALKKLIN